MSDELLGGLRAEIDQVDEQIVALVAKRMEVVHRVSDVKVKHGLPSYVPNRIAVVLDQRAAQGVAQGLDGDFVRRLYKLIIDEAIRLEDEVLGKPHAP
jgi:chorismate mutase-like protein